MKQNPKIIVINFMICIIICIGCFNDCEDCHEFILFINKTNRDISFQTTWYSTEKRWYCWPPNNQIDMVRKVPANSSRRAYYVGHNSYWEDYFKNNKFLNLLFADEDFKLSQPCDTIRKYVPISHHYQLTLEDLQGMDWTVVYPPE